MLESGLVRPRQARYQAALRPDMKCFLHSKTLSNFTPSQCNYFQLDCQDCVEYYYRMLSIRAFSGILSDCSPTNGAIHVASCGHNL